MIPVCGAGRAYRKQSSSPTRSESKNETRAIAFQISLHATFVILNVVKDLQVFFLLCEEGWRSDEDGPAPSCRKWAERQLRILRRRAPQDDKSMRVLWEFQMRLP
jgi:hypothetical protein